MNHLLSRKVLDEEQRGLEKWGMTDRSPEILLNKGHPKDAQERDQRISRLREKLAEENERLASK